MSNTLLPVTFRDPTVRSLAIRVAPDRWLLRSE